MRSDSQSRSTCVQVEGLRPCRGLRIPARIGFQSGRLPESWIPPVNVLEEGARVRLYVALSDERKAWLQRIHATLFHHGAPPAALRTAEGEQLLFTPELSASGRQAVAVALRQVERLDEEILSLRAELAGFARRQPGCRSVAGPLRRRPSHLGGDLGGAR
jgi:hypothetical protein